MQLILLEPEGNPQEYRIFIFPHPDVRGPVELLVSVTVKGTASSHPGSEVAWQPAVRVLGAQICLLSA